MLPLVFASSCLNQDYDFNIEPDPVATSNESTVLSSPVQTDSIIAVDETSISLESRENYVQPIDPDASNPYSDTGLDGIIGMPVNLVVKQNPYSVRYVTSKGVNKECKLENASNGSDQKFILRAVPPSAGGGYYFTCYGNSSHILSSGIWSNRPDIDILFVNNSPNPTMSSLWDIYKGSSDDTSFVLENQALWEVSPSGYGIYYLALGVNTDNGNLNFSKYAPGKRTQEFEIRPCDEFVITQMTLSQSGTSAVTDIPDFVITESYHNNTSTTQTMSTKITQKAQRTSSFNRKTSLTTTVSSTVKVGVSFLAEGSINTSIGAGQEWTYGEQETIADDREYNFPLVIDPHKRINVSIMVSRKKATINYRAQLMGMNTGIMIWEEGTWENVDCTDIVVSLEEYDLTTGLKTHRRRTVQGVPTQPTGVTRRYAVNDSIPYIKDDFRKVAKVTDNTATKYKP